MDLINGARQVFARDGFEPARISDIAAAAGKTRGAFYDHFCDKEDVFFAIHEEDLTHYLRRASAELETASTRAQRLEALTRHLLDVLKDRRRLMLILEFKIYAIRHPDRTKRLSELHRTMCYEGIETKLRSLMPEWQRRTQKQRRTENAQFGAILDGLLVNRLFDPPSLSDKEAAKFVRASLQAMLGPEARRSARRSRQGRAARF